MPKMDGDQQLGGTNPVLADLLAKQSARKAHAEAERLINEAAEARAVEERLANESAEAVEILAESKQDVNISAVSAGLDERPRDANASCDKPASTGDAWMLVDPVSDIAQAHHRLCAGNMTEGLGDSARCLGVENDTQLLDDQLLDSTACSIEPTYGEKDAVSHEDEVSAVSSRLDEQYQGVQRICKLALCAEGCASQRSRLTKASDDLKRDFANEQCNSRLHYVFAGLVSSGKSTLINSCLANGLEGFPAGVQLLPADALENTSAVTFLDVSPDQEVVQLHYENVELDERLKVTASRCSETLRFTQVARLEAELRGILEGVVHQKDTITRVMIQLPFFFDPVFHGDENLEAEQLKAWRNRFQNVTATDIDQVLDPMMAPVLVDTPGLDSPSMLGHLLSIMDEKSMVFCFLVDLTKPNPFGNHGFEVLKFLKEHLGLPFPPVIVFTKWEQFRKQWNDKRWVRQSARGESPEQMVGRMLTMVKAKLKEAGIDMTPYFAAVNSLTAMDQIGEGDDEDDNLEIARAKKEMCSFMQQLFKIGSKVAVPLRNHRLTRLMASQAQKLMNILLEDDEKARLLTRQAVSEMQGVADCIKLKFKTGVEQYFRGLQWTIEGVIAFQPAEPFTDGTCAISQIPSTFQTVFDRYIEEHGLVADKRSAILELCTLALKEIYWGIAQNISVYRDRAWQEFESQLWQRVGPTELLAKHFDLSSNCKLDYATDHALSRILRSFASYVPLRIVRWSVEVAVATVQRLGLWQWETCRAGALTAVLDALRDNQECFAVFLTEEFNHQVNETLKDVESYRMPSAYRQDTQSASSLISDLNAQRRRMEENLWGLLEQDTDCRWLVGDEDLRRVWSSVFESARMDGTPSASLLDAAE